MSRWRSTVSQAGGFRPNRQCSCALGTAADSLWTPRALFLRDRLDHELSPGEFCFPQRLLHECPHLGLVEIVGGLQDDVLHDLSASFENLLGVAELRTAEKKERHPARIEHDREQRVGGLVRRPEDDNERVVIVVDQLDCAGQPPPHLLERGASDCADFRRVSRHKAGELLLGRQNNPFCRATGMAARTAPITSTMMTLEKKYG